MPSMMEIYKRHNVAYDELVNAEDYQHNLANFLRGRFQWRDKRVCEAGIGTGRISKIFLDQIHHLYGFDREQHMLDGAARNLAQWADRMSLAVAENDGLPRLPHKADIFIEGWSFGHTLLEHEPHWRAVLDEMLARVYDNLSSAGVVILIESYGTGVAEPTFRENTQADSYHYLKTACGYHEQILKTDYLFPDYQEAARVMGFFFGDAMREYILAEKLNVIPEYTGVLFKENAR